MAQRIGHIEHKVQRSSQQLGQGPDGPREAKGLESPHAERMRMGNAFLSRAVGAFAGTARRREALPRLGAALERTKKARRVCERQAMARAEDAGAVRAALLLRGRARAATDVVPRVGSRVVAIGATRPATGGIGRAGRIVPPLDERLGGEIFVAWIVGKDRKTTAVTSPLRVGADIIGRVPQLHLPWQDRQGKGSAMRDEVGTLVRIGRVRGGAPGQFSTQAWLIAVIIWCKEPKTRAVFAGSLGSMWEPTLASRSAWILGHLPNKPH